MPTVEIYPTPDAVAHAAAARFVTIAHAASAASGRFSVALSGGTTPRRLFTLLAAEPYVGQVDWSRVHVFWGDERCVGPEDAQSNYRMSHETLLGRVAIPPAHIHRLQGEIDPQRAATEYDGLLRRFFFQGGGSNDSPHFDLVLLGMGDDGHTASLFPGTAAIHESERWVAAHYVDKLQTWRLTLTPVALNTARNVLFLVEGQTKAARLREVLEGSFQPDRLPAQIVKPTTGTLCWMLDSAAAAELSERPTAGPNLR